MGSQVVTTSIYLILTITSYFAWGNDVADDVLDSMSKDVWEWYLGHICSITNAFVMFPILVSALNDFLESTAEEKIEASQQRVVSPKERYPGRPDDMTDGLLESEAGGATDLSASSQAPPTATPGHRRSTSGVRFPDESPRPAGNIQGDIIPNAAVVDYTDPTYGAFVAKTSHHHGSNLLQNYASSTYDAETPKPRRLSCFDKIWMMPYRCCGFRGQRLVMFLIALGTSITPISFFKELVQLVPAVTLTLLALIMPVILARSVQNHEQVSAYLPMGLQPTRPRTWGTNLAHASIILIGVRCLVSFAH